MKGGEIMHKEIKPARIACFFVAIIMICSTLFSAIPTYANDSDNTVQDELIETLSNAKAIIPTLTVSGITAHCTVKVSASKSYLIKATMELQKKKSSGYKTVETWRSSKTGTSLYFSEKRNINNLCTYRLKARITVGSETHILYAYQK